ncbi:MAG: GNAT family N-acetyltransferase [Plesiomonas sp.]|uniref:GNAT family N-acetyltransferase n=1 Tax=Plesiomonas sp. TaxID=2486279 RepID=UPI003F328FBF
MCLITSLYLRPANTYDADILLAWRNDVITRQYSHSSDLISTEQHSRWLQSVMNDPSRKVYIAVQNSIPVGMARADLIEGIHILSWAVAPQARGRGIAKQIVKHLLDKTVLPIKAEIKCANLASIAVAKSNGLRLLSQQDDILHYVLP